MELKATGKSHIFEDVSLNGRELFNRDKWSGDYWMGNILMEIRDDN